MAQSRTSSTGEQDAVRSTDLLVDDCVALKEQLSVIRTHEAGTLRAGDAGQHGHPRRLGRTAARPRRRRLPRPARCVAAIVPGRRPRAEAVAPRLRNEYCLASPARSRCGRRATRTRDLATGEIEVIADERRGAESGRAPLPFPIDDARERRRGGAAASYRYLDLRRRGPARALRMRSKVNRIARDVLDGARLRRDRDADPDPVHARGRPRLPGAGAAPARALVRPAAVAPAVQAAADGRRAGALLPDRPLLPRRGLPRRPAAGVHPARHRDELRRAGRRHRRRRGVVCAAVWNRSASSCRRRSRG